MKRSATFLLASAALITALGALLALLFPGGDNGRAIVISAGVALAVQLATFSILRAMRGPSVMTGWGLGSLIRFAALITYGFLAQSTLDLPLTAALISLAAFLFATSVLEPVMLER